MKFYQDITLLPDAEIALYFLWEKVYQQIHLALVEMQDDSGKTPIGVAFPAYDKAGHALGNKLRLLSATAHQLERCRAEQWLSRLGDYLDFSPIIPVPGDIRAHACYRRLQPKSSTARMARRKAKRENLTPEAALAALNDRREQRCDAPFVWLKSLSNGERFRLFIEYEEVASPVPGAFSTYGLSNPGSVPVF